MSLWRSSPETMKMTVPCPECEGEMTVSDVTPTMFGNVGEEVVYRCRKCGFTRTRTIQTPWQT
jgi:transposase-like protein